MEVLKEKQLTKEDYEKLKEKILNLKRKVLKIVEELIELDVKEEKFLDCCKYLCKDDYYDINVERSIQNYCGYVLCMNELNEKTKKKFKISLKTHQVFDLTHRKMFCSDLCFTKSNYVKEQLIEEPLWIRDDKIDTNFKIKLYNKTKKYQGDEVELDISLVKELIKELHKEGDNLNCKLYCDELKNEVNNENIKNQNDEKVKTKKNNKMLDNKNTDYTKKENFLKDKIFNNLDKSINFPYINEKDFDKLRISLENVEIKEKKKPLLDTVIEKTEKLKLD